MATIITRLGKGAALTWAEADANFTNLNTDKVEQLNPVTSGTLTHSGSIVLSGFGNRIKGNFSDIIPSNRLLFQTSGTNLNTSVAALPNGTGVSSSFQAFNSSDPDNSSRGYLSSLTTGVQLHSDKTGTGAYLPMTFHTGGAERLRIDAAGGVLVTNAAGGLGYGTGSGGTVTQATNKATAVTLNKPCGQITTHNAALAAGDYVGFSLFNSLISPTDTVILTPTYASNGHAYSIRASVASGAVSIIIENSGAISLTDALVINFAVIKGSTA